MLLISLSEAFCFFDKPEDLVSSTHVLRSLMIPEAPSSCSQNKNMTDARKARGMSSCLARDLISSLGATLLSLG